MISQRSNNCACLLLSTHVNQISSAPDRVGQVNCSHDDRQTKVAPLTCLPVYEARTNSNGKIMIYLSMDYLPSFSRQMWSIFLGEWSNILMWTRWVVLSSSLLTPSPSSSASSIVSNLISETKPSCISPERTNLFFFVEGYRQQVQLN